MACFCICCLYNIQNKFQGVIIKKQWWRCNVYVWFALKNKCNCCFIYSLKQGLFSGLLVEGPDRSRRRFGRLHFYTSHSHLQLSNSIWTQCRPDDVVAECSVGYYAWGKKILKHQWLLVLNWPQNRLRFACRLNHPLYLARTVPDFNLLA